MMYKLKNSFSRLESGVVKNYNAGEKVKATEQELKTFPHLFEVEPKIGPQPKIKAGTANAKANNTAEKIVPPAPEN